MVLVSSYFVRIIKNNECFIRYHSIVVIASIENSTKLLIILFRVQHNFWKCIEYNMLIANINYTDFTYLKTLYVNISNFDNLYTTKVDFHKNCTSLISINNINLFKGQRIRKEFIGSY